MSKCLNCGKTTPINSRTYRHKKYCDRKCTADYYSKTKRYSESPQWDWGTRGPKAKKEQEDKLKVAQAELARLRETMVDRQTILNHFGMKKLSIRNFVIELGIESQSVKLGPHEVYIFYSKKDAEILINTIQEKWGHKLKGIPEGYISSAEAAELMGVKKPRPEQFQNKVEVINHHGYFICKQEVLDYIKKRDEAIELAETRRQEREAQKLERIAERKRLRREKELEEIRKQEEWNANHAEQKKKREDLKLKGWIEYEKVNELGLSKQNIYKYIGNNKIRHIDFGYGLHRLYKQEDVVFLTDYLNKIQANQRSKGGLKVIRKDKTDPFPYETRMFNSKFPKWKKQKNRLKSIEANEHYRDQHFNHDNITHLDCKKCGAKKPYHEFRYRRTKTGRDPVCKECRNARYQERKEHYKISQQKYWARPKVKMRNLVAGTVKKDISFALNKYYQIEVATIWEEIQKQCGYNVEDLVKHIESQFDSKMNWQNNARSTVGYRWEMDHIVPRSELRYDSIHHPNFKKCWDLSNLRPLSALENKSRWFDDLK